MKKLLAVLITFILIISMAACDVGSDEPISRSGFYLGTIITITVYGSNGGKNLDKAFSEIERLESILSKNIESSDIYAINKSAGITLENISPETHEVLTKSMEYYIASKGYFDITIGPIVDLWKIGTEEAVVPGKEEINSAMELLGIDNIILYSGDAGLVEPGMSIDTGGIAKGFIADKVVEILRTAGCSGALINLGGNVITLGEKPSGDKWKIGIQDPFKATGEYMQVVEIGEMSVVTSGPYERNFEKDGVVYHHILDPFTGYPVVNDIAGVTVISEKSIDGDGLSTAVFAMDLAEGLELIESLENTECLIIKNDGSIIMSSGFKKYLSD